MYIFFQILQLVIVLLLVYVLYYKKKSPFITFHSFKENYFLKFSNSLFFIILIHLHGLIFLHTQNIFSPFKHNF